MYIWCYIYIFFTPTHLFDDMLNRVCPKNHAHGLHCYVLSKFHYRDVIMGTIASQITSLTIVYSTVYSDADQRTHQSSSSLAIVRGIHRRPVNSPHKWPVTQKIFPFDDVIMSGVVLTDFTHILQRHSCNETTQTNRGKIITWITPDL